MSLKLNVGLPDGLDIPGNWKLQFAAVSPTDGSGVANVNVSGVSIVATIVGTGPPELVPEPVAPLWVPIPDSDLQPANG